MTRSPACLSAWLAPNLVLALTAGPAVAAIPVAEASASRPAICRHRLADGSGPVFSLEGRFVLTSSDQSGAFDAYAARTTSPPRQVLSSFPEDERFLVISDRGGDERTRL